MTQEGEALRRTFGFTADNVTREKILFSSGTCYRNFEATGNCCFSGELGGHYSN